MTAKGIPAHVQPDSVCTSAYDAVVGLPYESAQYKFMQHLVPHRLTASKIRVQPHLEAVSNEYIHLGSNQMLDAIENSYALKSSSARMNNSRFAVEHTQPGVGSSLNSNPRNRVSSLHTDSVVDPYMHNQRDLQVLWIKPQDFFKDDRINQEDFSLKDISILMKKKGEVQTKRVVSRFQPSRERLLEN